MKLPLLVIAITFLILSPPATVPCRAQQEGGHQNELPIGQPETVEIRAHDVWNHTGIHISRGQRYRFIAKGIWCDFYKPTTADGYESVLFTPIEHKLRQPEMNWLALVGCVDEKPENTFLIGRENELIARDDGELTCFANGIPGKYGKKWGSVRLTVTRLDWP